jgi:hypothetical protein
LLTVHSSKQKYLLLTSLDHLVGTEEHSLDLLLPLGYFVFTKEATDRKINFLIIQYYERTARKSKKIVLWI